MTLKTRHWTFLGLLVVVTVTMLLNLQPDVEVTDRTQAMYDYIDSLPANSVLLVSFDHEASSLPEIRPIGEALLRHAFSKGHRLVGMALLAEGTVIGYRLMQSTAAEHDREYGRDWVFLGFKPQYIAAILSMGESIKQTFPEDYLGRPYTDLECLQGVVNYEDVAGVLSIADGSLTTHWIEYGSGRYGVPVVAGVTAAMVTTYDPYIASDQLGAMVGGLRGAAEYEKLIDVGGGGARGMLAQTSAHLYVILLVLIGNAVYLFGSRGRREA
jgi:hypothetical protein